MKNLSAITFISAIAITRCPSMKRICGNVNSSDRTCDRHQEQHVLHQDLELEQQPG